MILGMVEVMNLVEDQQEDGQMT